MCVCVWRGGGGIKRGAMGLQAVQYNHNDGTQQNPGGPHDCKFTLAFISSGWRRPFVQIERIKLINQTEEKKLQGRQENTLV